MSDDESECCCPMCGGELELEDTEEWTSSDGETGEEHIYFCENCGKMSETTIERIKDYADDFRVAVSKCAFCGHCWISQKPKEMSHCPQCNNIEKNDMLHSNITSAIVPDVVERLGSPEKLWDEIVKKELQEGKA
jgi:hypothetical protein